MASAGEALALWNCVLSFVNIPSQSWGSAGAQRQGVMSVFCTLHLHHILYIQSNQIKHKTDRQTAVSTKTTGNGL